MGRRVIQLVTRIVDPLRWHGHLSVWEIVLYDELAKTLSISWDTREEIHEGQVRAPEENTKAMESY